MPSLTLPRRAAVLLIASIAAAGWTLPVLAAPSNVVISEFQVRGDAGGNDEFVEIFNSGSIAVNISGWTLQGCAAASGGLSTRATVPSGVMLGAGKHYLFVNTAAAGYNGATTGDQNYATGFTDFLSSNQSGIQLNNAGSVRQDGVGSTTSPCREGTGLLTSGSATATDNLSYRRKLGETQDNDNNAADFDGPQLPVDIQNSASPAVVVGGGGTSFSIDDVSLSEGNAGTTAFTFTVTKNGSNAASFNYATTDGTATAASGDYAAASGTLTFGAGTSGSAASQTITVNVNGDLLNEGVETFNVVLSGSGVTFAKATGIGTILNDDATCSVTHSIMQIQGTAHLSTLAGQSGITTRGVITQLDSNGFFMQDPQGDGNPLTSDGVFVFTSGAPAASLIAGDPVCVTGTVTEFRPGGVNVNGLTFTEMTNVTVTEIPGLFANPVVTPTLLGAGGRPFPTTVIDNDTGNGGGQGNVEIPAQTTYDPAEDGIDFYESLEGMLVRVNSPTAVGPDPGNFGEIWMVSDGLTGHIGSGRNARGGITINANDNNPERFLVSQSFTGATVPTTVNVGDGFTQSGQPQLTAIVDYLYITGLSSGYYYFAPTSALTRVAGSITPEVTAISGSATTLTIADYNVENLAGNEGQAKYDGLAAQIVNNLKAPDILALIEIQDNNGAADDGTVDATQTLTRLRNTIAALPGAPNYQFFDIAPQNDQDGGEPGGNIRVGYFYNPARVSFVGGTAGNATTSTQPTLVDGKLNLSLNPGRVDPTNPNFADSRKPLAAVFEFNGRRVLVVNNHFRSKGGSDPAYGKLQPPVNGGVVERTGQAEAVNRFVDAALALDPNARIVVLGDLNEFSFNPPIQVLTGAQGTGAGNPVNVVLTDLVDLTLPIDERYTYVFEGQSQVLDHVLVSNSLLPGVQIDVLHVNSEFDNQQSDHDPSVAALTIPACTPGTLSFKNAPYTVSEGNADVTTTVTVARNGGDCGAVSAKVSSADPASGSIATAGVDYVAVINQLVSFSDGDTADKTFNVTIKGDLLNEASESFALALSSATGGANLGGSTSVTIGDNDPLPTVSFDAAASSVAENAGLATVTLRLSAPAGRAVIVPFTVDGSATAGAGADYTLGTSSPLTIPAGETTASITLLINDDATPEPDETVRFSFDVGLLNAVAGTPSTHVLTIPANDSAGPTALVGITATTSGNATSDTPVPGGPAGSFTFTSNFCNASGNTYVNAYSLTTALTNGNQQLSRTNVGEPSGVGATQNLPDAALTPGECVATPYRIGLASKAAFTFKVTLLAP